MNMTAVAALRTHYLTKVKAQPSLYASGNYINVVLPTELKDYANAAAGTGVGETHTPVGIRVRSSNPAVELAAIFESVESLAKFIASSECNAHIAVERAVARQTNKKQKRAIVDSRLANAAWTEILKKHNVQELAARFSKETVIAARKSLTVNEFELRFGLAA